MFVRDFVHVDRPMDAVRPQFLTRADLWLAPLADRACNVSLEVGVTRLRGDALVLPLVWVWRASDTALPPLLADLEVAPILSTRTEIAFCGTYAPVREGLGRRVDELVRHRLAEASVRSFLTEIACAVQAAKPPRP